MAMKIGTRLGPYEITAPIGAGGMGAVYRATDSKLKRDVAIKVVAESVSGDRSRLARLEQEARVLASLNHPHIASIYGLEELEGMPCLVLEFVEGKTLAERLSSGALTQEKSADLGRQIASALEAAHEKGIIHRDLKPGNIMVTPDEVIKVLDFGLAKLVQPEIEPAEASQEETSEKPETREGAVLGTLPYMSPEQVRGEKLDAKTDIWSFGCVMYEMAAGRPAFAGKTPAEFGAAILEREPDWDALRGNCSAAIERLIRRCLRKDPRRRLHDIADARIEIEDAKDETAGGTEALPASFGRRRWRERLLWMAAGLMAGMLPAIFVMKFLGASPGAAPAIVRASLTRSGDPAPANDAVPSVSISPDGRTVVFAAKGKLYRSSFDGATAEPIPGTEGGRSPSFSPDGEWMAFLAGTRLLKVPVGGGSPISLCEVPPVAFGLTWAPDGRIVFARSYNGPLYVVPGSGGEPQILSRLEPDEHAHAYPQALPGNKLLYTAVLGRDFQDVDAARVVALDLDTGERHVALEGATLARYVGDGWIVFVRGQSVFAAPFDLEKLRVTAPPAPLAEKMALSPEFQTAQFAVSRDGTLVYVSGPAAENSRTEALGLDRQGHETQLAVPAGFYGAPSVSPDGRKIALHTCEGFRCTVVVYDRDRHVLTSVVPEPGRFLSAVWSPDGRRLALASVLQGDPRLVVRASDGSGSLEFPTPATEDAEIPNSWSPDGKTIAYTVIYTADRGGSRLRLTSDIWLVSADGSSPPRPWLETPHRENGARISPDGKEIAYVSDESGKNEVYVSPLEGTGKLQISSEGGIEPVWAAGGREILYRQGSTRLFAVDLGPGPEIRPGPPRLLLTKRFDTGWGTPDRHHYWDISPDGQELVFTRSTHPPDPALELIVVTGWLASLDRLGAGG